MTDTLSLGRVVRGVMPALLTLTRLLHDWRTWCGPDQTKRTGSGSAGRSGTIRPVAASGFDVAAFLARIACNDTGQNVTRAPAQRSGGSSGQGDDVDGRFGLARPEMASQTGDGIRSPGMTDDVTGLPNKRALLNGVESCIARKKSFALLVVDLDGVRTVRDRFGHGVAIGILKEASRRLRSVAGPSGFAGRLGGTRFALLLPDACPEDIHAVAKNVVDALIAPLELEGQRHGVGASVGVALYPDHGSHAESLMWAADRALHYIQRSSGWRPDPIEPVTPAPQVVERFAETAGMRLIRDHADMPTDLAHALRDGQFHLAFQPIHATGTGLLAGYESLARWTCPKRGNVQPDMFMPIAEASDQLCTIGTWVLREACRKAAMAGGNWYITVNVSAQHFTQVDFLNTVDSILSESGLSPRRLVLELTEKSLTLDRKQIRDKMRKLRAWGVRLVLDDYGSGVANIAHLYEFRFDAVKIDRSILLLPPMHRRNVLSACLRVAESFGYPTVVEGVETLDDWLLVRDLGASYAQGYHCGKPAVTFEMAGFAKVAKPRWTDPGL